MTSTIKRYTLLAFCALVATFFLTGCNGIFGTSKSTRQNEATTALTEVTSYVSQVKSYADTLSTKSSELTQAISDSDLVNIKLKRDEIADCLQKASEVEVPELIKTDGEKYANSCLAMKEVLCNYTDIVISTIESGGSIKDMSTLQQLSEMQSKYDEAVKNFESADSAINSTLESLKNPLQNK